MANRNFSPRPVDQYSATGILLHSYESIMKASQATGLVPHQIRRALPGAQDRRFTCGGFYWRYKGQKIGNIKKTPKPGKAKMPIRVEKEGADPQVFPSQVAAARHLGVTQGNIAAALARRGRVYGYFITHAA
jgi:hypothetical protein